MLGVEPKLVAPKAGAAVVEAPLLKGEAPAAPAPGVPNEVLPKAGAVPEASVGRLDVAPKRLMPPPPEAPPLAGVAADAPKAPKGEEALGVEAPKRPGAALVVAEAPGVVVERPEPKGLAAGVDEGWLVPNDRPPNMPPVAAGAAAAPNGAAAPDAGAAGVELNEKDPKGEAPVGAAAAAAGAAATGAAPAAGVEENEKDPKGAAEVVVAGAPAVAAGVAAAGVDENENEPKADVELAAAAGVAVVGAGLSVMPPPKENKLNGAGAAVELPAAGAEAAAAAAGAGVVVVAGVVANEKAGALALEGAAAAAAAAGAGVVAAGVAGAVAADVEANEKAGALALEGAAASGFGREKEPKGADDDEAGVVDDSGAAAVESGAAEEAAPEPAKLKLTGASSVLPKSDLATGDLPSCLGVAAEEVAPSVAPLGLVASVATAAAVVVVSPFLAADEVMGATEGPNENSPGGRTSPATDASGLGNGLKSNSELAPLGWVVASFGLAGAVAAKVGAGFWPEPRARSGYSSSLSSGYSPSSVSSSSSSSSSYSPSSPSSSSSLSDRE